MKYLFFIFFLPIATASFAQIHLVNSGTDKRIDDMYFKDEAHGYAIADKGTILKTEDGGENWIVIHQDTTLYMQTSILCIADSVFCFGKDLLGNNIRLAFKQNTGNYSTQVISYNVYYPVFWGNEIWYINGMTGNGIYTYNNVGVISEVFPGVEHFNIQDEFISASDERYIYYSNNYGATWDTVEYTPPTLSSGPYKSFYNGGDTLMTVTFYPAVLHYSINGGQSWNEHNIPDGNGYIFEDKEIWKCGNFANKKEIYYSLNLGQSFDSIVVDKEVSNLYFSNNNTAFAYGDSGVIYKIINLPSVSINTLLLNKTLNIFPNPTKNKIRLQYDNLHIQSLLLTDLSGRIIKTFPPESKMLDISGLAAGLYFLQVKAKEGEIADKIMIHSR